MVNFINPETFKSNKDVKRAYTQAELDNDVCVRSPYQICYERVIVILAFLAMMNYIIARWIYMFTIPSHLWASIPMLLIETVLVVPGLYVSYFLLWNRRDRPSKNLEDFATLMPNDYPTVDVLIPCLNEPVEIIKATVNAAMNLDYPTHKVTVCVCDDGRRKEVKAMVEDMGAKHPNANGVIAGGVKTMYVAREKVPGVYHHAKAGNLNNAILNAGTSGDLLMILDCDMIAKPDFLKRLVPHFYQRQVTEAGAESYLIDEKVALVQSPQAFFNVAEGDLLGQQYRYFYGPGNKGWDGSDCAPCCGTNNIFSRKALTSIGGFTYGSITEDFLTSMTLHSSGFQTKYAHEYVAFGLAPETLADFMKQRRRWAAGAVEIFVYNNSLVKKGLTWKQKYLYFWAGLQAYLAFPLLLLTFVPFLSIFNFGSERLVLSPMNGDVWVVSMFHFLLWNIWMLFVAYQDIPKSYLAHSVQESVFMMYTKFHAVSEVHWKGKLTFKVTNKGAKNAEESEFWNEFAEVRPFAFYYLVGICGIAKLLYCFITQTNVHYIEDFVALIWLLIVMWQMAPPIKFFVTTQLLGVDYSWKSPDAPTEESL